MRESPGIESIGITDRTHAILNAYSRSIHPILDQDAGRETRQIELKSVGATGYENLVELL